MAGDFDGSLHDMQPDPEADDQEQDEEGQERMDQVVPLTLPSSSAWPQANHNPPYCTALAWLSRF